MAQTIDVVEMFKQAALEVDNRKLPKLTRDTVIATLGMDSVAVMELVSYFEEKLAVRIPDEDLGRLRTLGAPCNHDAPPLVRRRVQHASELHPRFRDVDLVLFHRPAPSPPCTESFYTAPPTTQSGERGILSPTRPVRAVQTRRTRYPHPT